MEYVPDKQVNVEFYEGSVESAVLSEAQGHPVFVSKPFCKIMIPGSQNTIIDVPVDETHRNRFPVQWAKYQAGERNSAPTGWALEQWPSIKTAQVQTLKHLGIQTVEQLADISDTVTQGIGPGGMELRTRAKAALAVAAGTADAERAAVQMERQQAEMAELRAQLAAVLANQSDEQPAAPRRGRPRSTEAA